MNAGLLMVLASLLFATMGVCVKFAASDYSSSEIVMYRGAVGTIALAILVRARGQSLRTSVPWMHFWRAMVGVAALMLWFYAITGLPLATSITLNYMSAVWMAVFLIGGAIAMGGAKVDGRLVATVLVGFAGVALVLRPTIGADQHGYGIAGLVSGMMSALAYLQVAALGRAGEPEGRVVFYFSLGSVVVGLVASLTQGLSPHKSWQGVGWLLGTGVLATAAQLCMTRAYTIGKPLANASLSYLGIVFSAIYGVWLFNDPMLASTAVGIVLIIGAGLAATLLRARSTRAQDVPTGGEP